MKPKRHSEPTPLQLAISGAAKSLKKQTELREIMVYASEIMVVEILIELAKAYDAILDREVSTDEPSPSHRKGTDESEVTTD